MEKSHEKFTFFINYMKLIFVSICSIVFILMNAILLMEFSSRVSTDLFLEGKIDELEGRIVQVINRDFSSISEEDKDMVRNLRFDLQVYNQVLDSINYLSISGSENVCDSGFFIVEKIGFLRDVGRVNSRLGQFQMEKIDLEADRADLLERLRNLQVKGVDLLTDLSGAEFGFFGESDLTNNNSSLELQRALRQSVSRNQSEINVLNLQIEQNLERLDVINRNLDNILNTEEVCADNANDLSIRFRALISSFNNEIIISLIMIFSGGLNAIILSIRSRDNISIMFMLSGMISGFVVYLIIKGGGEILLVGFYRDGQSTVNPYAGAFAGFLSGLFSEKAYSFLSAFTDDLEERLVKTRVLENKPDEQESKPSTGDPNGADSPGR